MPRNRFLLVLACLTAVAVAAAAEDDPLISDRLDFTREDIDGNATAYLDVGLTYLIHENLQLDGRVGQGFNGLDEDWFTGFGLAARI